MLLEALVLIVGYYLFAGISVYVYSVMQGLEILGYWNLSITKDSIAGMIKYPRWLLFWLEWIVSLFRKE
ncbi:MAG: hypothetical protein ABS939_14265 [Psychrobacillus sp.]